jgi:hypothetical protein
VVLACLAALLLLQIGFQHAWWGHSPAPEELSAPPDARTLRLASLGDPIPIAKLLTLYVQSYDSRANNRLRYRDLDYGNLTAWLDALLRLDPSGQYPLLLASRVYADVSDQGRQRQMMDFVYREFLEDPKRRWRWLAEMAVIAKHRLGDLPLARMYAAAIQQQATGDDVPLWARQMEAFILEDMNELEAARVMIGGFIAKGMVKEPGELRFLEGRLHDIESRQRRDAAMQHDGNSSETSISRHKTR